MAKTPEITIEVAPQQIIEKRLLLELSRDDKAGMVMGKDRLDLLIRGLCRKKLSKADTKSLAGLIENIMTLRCEAFGE